MQPSAGQVPHNWPTLPSAIRAGILAMVNASKGANE
jgi:hypothetical protein